MLEYKGEKFNRTFLGTRNDFLRKIRPDYGKRLQTPALESNM